MKYCNGRRTITALLTMAVLVLAGMISVKFYARADGQNLVGMMVSLDANDEILSGTAAVAMEAEGEVVVVAGSSVLEDNAAAYRFFGDNRYDAEAVGTAEDYSASLFSIEKGGADSKILGLDTASEREQVEMHYLSKDGSLTEKIIPVLITGYEQIEGYYKLRYTLADGAEAALVELQENGCYLPAAAVNSRGSLVGIFMPNGECISFFLDPSGFSQGSEDAEPSEGYLFPEDGSDGKGGDEIKGRDIPDIEGNEDDSGKESTDQGEISGEDTDDDDKSKKDDEDEKDVNENDDDDDDDNDDDDNDDVNEWKESLIVYCGIGAAVLLLIAGVVIAVVVSGRKKKKGQFQPVMPTEPMVPIMPTAPAVPVVPDTPVMAVPSGIPGAPVSSVPGQNRSVQLYLCCEGGVMDGRQYLITSEGLLMGRDPSCNICYPPETPGVSRRHCKLFWNNGVLMVMDLGSTSGTYIHGTGQIAANVPVAVMAGDKFYLGERCNAFVIRMV